MQSELELLSAEGAAQILDNTRGPYAWVCKVLRDIMSCWLVNSYRFVTKSSCFCCQGQAAQEELTELMTGSSAGLLLYRWWIFGLCEEQGTINQLWTSQNTGFYRSDIRIIRIEIYSTYGCVILARLPCVLSGVGTIFGTGRSPIQRVVLNIEKHLLNYYTNHCTYIKFIH